MFVVSAFSVLPVLCHRDVHSDLLLYRVFYLSKHFDSIKHQASSIHNEDDLIISIASSEALSYNMWYPSQSIFRRPMTASHPDAKSTSNCFGVSRQASMFPKPIVRQTQLFASDFFRNTIFILDDQFCTQVWILVVRFLESVFLQMGELGNVEISKNYESLASSSHVSGFGIPKWLSRGMGISYFLLT